MEKIILSGHHENPQRRRNGLRPAQILAGGFAAAILIGTVLLSLPLATVDKEGAPLLAALFTATSAVCVTGLVVVDTGTYFSTFGQLVIMGLIQIGGLGFMTFATLFAIMLGRRITLKERILLQEALNQVTMEGVVRLSKYVIQITLFIEALGAIILSLRFGMDLGWGRGLYYGVFHAVSAFNNAGFDLFGEYRSVMGYTGDFTVNLTLMGLIIVGGLGFTVISEIYVHRGRKFNLHSQIVLRASALLILVGGILVLLMEYTNPETLGVLNNNDKILGAVFMSVTSRTAGFNTISIADLRDTTLLLIVILMYIGASPGSTGGGIKTTTFVAVFQSIIATLRGRCDVNIRERTLHEDTIKKATAIAFSAMVLILGITCLLTITEEAEFLDLLFEATSAFATVGLSTGITPGLSTFGRIAIILTMFVGRVGPLTLAFAMAQRSCNKNYIKYPEEKIMIG